MTAPDLLPCPFCTEGKTVSSYFDHEQGDKWGYASCDACGARGPELRTNYDRDDNAPWRAEAIAAWNRRATPVAVTPDEVEHAPLPEAAIHGMRAIAANMDARNVLFHPQVKALVEAIEDIRNYGTILTSRKRHAALDAALADLREGGGA